MANQGITGDKISEAWGMDGIFEQLKNAGSESAQPSQEQAAETPVGTEEAPVGTKEAEAGTEEAPVDTKEAQEAQEAQEDEKEAESIDFVSDFKLDEDTDGDAGSQDADSQRDSVVDRGKIIQEELKLHGIDGSSIEEVASSMKSLKERVARFEEYMDPTVLNALDSGVITIEEVVSKGLATKYGEGFDDIEVLKDMLDESGITGEDATEAIDDMPEAMRKVYANQYREKINSQRESVMRHIRNRMTEKVSGKEKETQEAISQVSEFNKTFSKEVAKMDKIAGTNTHVTQKMKDMIIKVQANPDLLKQVIWGKGNNALQGAHNLARIMYAETILKDASISAKNSTKKEIIEKASNVSVGNPTGKPPRTHTRQTQLSALEGYLEGKAKYFNS